MRLGYGQRMNVLHFLKDMDHPKPEIFPGGGLCSMSAF